MICAGCIGMCVIVTLLFTLQCCCGVVCREEITSPVRAETVPAARVSQLKELEYGFTATLLPNPKLHTLVDSFGQICHRVLRVKTLRT